MIKLFSYWTGYLVVTLEGAQKERLLNLALKKGIAFWDLHYYNGQALIKIKPGDFFKLRPLAYRSRCRVKIKRKIGCPFWISQGKKRKGLIAGLLLFALLLHLATSFVWFIDVSGNESISKEDILTHLSEMQISPGSWKRDIDTNSIADKLVLGFEKVGWAEASLRGAYLSISIVEKSTPLEDNTATHLVAAKDGLIENTLVLAGEPRVEEGDTVSRGEILIEGVEILKTDDSEPSVEDADVEYIPVKAKGIIEARVWYRGFAEVYLKKTGSEATGEVATTNIIRFNGNSVLSWGEDHSPFRNYKMEKRRRYWLWRNINLPVEIVTLKYKEVKLVEEEISVKEAISIADKEAWSLLEKQLPPEALILRKHKDDRVFEKKVTRSILVETRENIAVPGS